MREIRLAEATCARLRLEAKVGAEIGADTLKKIAGVKEVSVEPEGPP